MARILTWLRTLTAAVLMGSVVGTVLGWASVSAPRLNDAGSRARAILEQYQVNLIDAIRAGAVLGAMCGVAVAVGALLLVGDWRNDR